MQPSVLISIFIELLFRVIVLSVLFVEIFVVFLAKRDTIFCIKSVFDIPVVSIEVVYRQVSATLTTDLASVIIAFHNLLHELPIARVIVSVCLANCLGDCWIEFYAMSKNLMTGFRTDGIWPNL